MSYLRSLLFACTTLITIGASAQQLIINEVSQGSGAGEYVEFVVIGTPTCQTPVPTIDLRGVIFDDNNGYFASGSGTGIATGAVRFANIAFWSAVPQGTYIVIYNESDVNPALPPADNSLTDGNCRLVLPANSNLLEGTSVSPTTSVSTYPPSASWTAGSGTWNQLAMSNSNDSFQIPNLGVNGTPLHAVSWGNNTNGAIIYFSGSASNKVFSFVNTVSNDPNVQANWTSGTVGVNETPGAANNAANDAWIASMNPQCGIAAGLQVTVQTTANTLCGANCNGTATAQVTGGTAPYTYSWNNAATTGTISSLCAGTYTVTVTDAGGCSFTAQGTVVNNSGTISVSVSATANTLCGANCNGTATAQATGGTLPYTYSWDNAATTATISNLCAGTYSVTVTDASGCNSTAQGTVVNNSGTISVTVSETANTLCGANCNGTATAQATGGTLPYTYSWDNAATTATISNLCAGTYTVTVTDANGCGSTAQGTVVNNSGTISVTVSETANTLCGANCNGTATAQATGGTLPYTYSWDNAATTATISNLCAGSYTVNVTDANGCGSTAQATVVNNSGSISVSVSETNETCSGNCDGALSATATGGVQPYTYLWDNGAISANITSLCPGTFTVNVTDQNGCQTTASGNVLAGQAIGDASILTTGPFMTTDNPVQLQSVTSGGTWLTADCANCLTTAGVFDPGAAGAGTFQICHTVGSGACMGNDCIQITVTACTPIQTNEIVQFCPGDSVQVFGNWEYANGTFTQTFTAANGCDSIHTIELLHYPIFNNHDAAPLCPGDSILVFGQWVTQPGDYTHQQFTPDGCEYTFYFHVMAEACDTYEFSLFVPNAFTPNGDGTNDTFKIEITGGMVDEGYIFNRWGNQVATFDAQKITWDGKTKSGDNVQDGVYTYLIYYTPTNGVRDSVHGFVTVLR